MYIDARLTTMSPEGLSLIGPLGLNRLKALHWAPDAIGGLTLGADPIAYAISYASALDRVPVRAFTVRKEAKTHGTEQLIEGPFRPADRVVVVEDVITTGGSALRAIEAVRAHGGYIVGVLGLLDREEGGRERLEEAGTAVTILVNISDLLPLLPA